MFKVIISGSRTFDDYELLKSYCDFVLSLIKDNIEIVSGGAKGADLLGEQYAREMGYSIKVFPAKWDKHGKSAGFIRNQQMANYADALIAFWDGESVGTKHMIETAKQCNMKIKVKKYLELPSE